MSAVRTHSRHSALATGTALDAPFRPFVRRHQRLGRETMESEPSVPGASTGAAKAM